MYGPTAPARDAAGDALRRDAQDAPLLAVTDLVAGYGRRPVLQGLTFCLRAGECAALLGPNGSGKTTLLRALSGVLAPWSGEVRMADRPLASLRPRERARRVAVVPQRGPCPEDLTAREMVLLGRYAHLSPWGWYSPGDHRAADWPPRTRQGWPTAGCMSFLAANCKGCCWPEPWRRKALCCCWTSWPPVWTWPA